MLEAPSWGETHNPIYILKRGLQLLCGSGGERVDVRRRAGRRRLQRPGSSDWGGLSRKEELNFHYILRELIELTDGLDWGKGDRLELVCLNLGPVLF